MNEAEIKVFFSSAQAFTNYTVTLVEHVAEHHTAIQVRRCKDTHSIHGTSGTQNPIATAHHTYIGVHVVHPNVPLSHVLGVVAYSPYKVLNTLAIETVCIAHVCDGV